MADLFEAPGAPREPEIACVSLPAFPLQMLLRAHPEWREDPLVIVEDDRPRARILWANRAARRQRIRSGLRFSEAQSLVARLRAVPEAELDPEAAAAEIFEALLAFSPRVEPAAPGLFWVDPTGLGRLYDSPRAWASRLHRRVESFSYVASVVLGWRRAGTLAIAGTASGPRVLRDPEEESREADEVPLARLDLPAALREELGALGLSTFGEFRRLPAAGVASRFGADVAALHDFVCGRTWTPLRARFPVRPVSGSVAVEPPDEDRTRLLFAVKGVLHGIARELGEKQEGIQHLELRFELDHAPPHTERIETASATLDVTRLIDLVRLRLGSVELAAPVENIRIEVGVRPLRPGQLDLLEAAPRRDRAAAAAALARVKAAFGSGSVVRARITDSHLPEGRLRWEPVAEVPAPAPPELSGPMPLVRTLLPRPIPLADPPRHERERWLGRHGAVTAMHGPDRRGDRWWDAARDRDYFLVETRTGAVLWLFQDRETRSWFLHGFVD